MPRPLTALGCALLLVAPLAATTFTDETTADLAARADRVCCARCESVEARRDPRTGIVFTYVRLRLLEDLKGRVEDVSFELRLAGGKADGVETVVAGMPRFAAGQESVLLLGGRNRDGFRVALQAHRVVLPLVRDKAGNRRLRAAVSGFSELEGKRKVSLDDFRGALRRELQARAEAGH